MSEIVDIVDNQDNIIGQNTRHESYRKFTTNRVVDVFLLDTQGRIALQRRSDDCSFMPGAWGVSVGGHVSSGRTYQETAHIELEEELNIKCELKYVGKEYVNRVDLEKNYNCLGADLKNRNDHFYFTEIYEGIYEGDYNFIDGEAQDFKYFTKNEIQKMIDDNVSMLSGSVYLLRKYYL